MERVLRKTDSTTLSFTKQPEGRIDVFGNGVGEDNNPHQIVEAEQVFEVRMQDNQVALVLKERGSPAGDEDGQACLEMLKFCGELGGRKESESYPEYLRRLIDCVTGATAYGAAEKVELRSPIRQTHTYVTMEVTQSTWNEIATKMRDAEYDQAFMENDEIDMHGIAVVPSSEPSIDELARR